MTHFQMGRSLHHLNRPSHQILSLLAVLNISLWKPRLILIKYMCLCLSVYVPTTLGLHNHLKKGITCISSTASYLHLSYYFQFPYNWRTELQSPYRVHQYHSERRKACWVQIKKINIFLQQAKLGQNKLTHFQCRKVSLIKVITIQPLLLLHNIWVPFTFFMCHLSNWELKLFVHQENCNTYSGTNIIIVCWTLAVAEPKTLL